MRKYRRDEREEYKIKNERKRKERKKKQQQVMKKILSACEFMKYLELELMKDHLVTWREMTHETVEYRRKKG